MILGLLCKIASSPSELFYNLPRETILKILSAKPSHRLLQQVIPPEDLPEVFETPDKRSTKYINRPGFSLPLMTYNFRRFNARL